VSLNSAHPVEVYGHNPEVITQCVSPVIFKITGPTYWCNDLDLSGSRDVSCHVTFWFPMCHFL